MQEINDRFELLLEKVKKANLLADENIIRSAFDYACGHHEGQLRKDGSPFVSHPLATAEIVADLGMDTDSIAAALLHDCIEDTGATFEEIKKLFGRAVADIVEAVTKLTRVPYTTKEEEQIENLRKMFLAMAKDIRVIIIKIADRLHNMRTINYQSEKKQREKAFETMEIYAPLAHRLGMARIKCELEDLALQCLDPVGYREITEELIARAQTHENFLIHIKERIGVRLKDAGIEAHIDGRVKHIYSIYRKMYNQHKAMYEIYDLYAVRVIVKEMADCYNVMGFIHDLYKPIPGRFKDYISTPKPNMYQSLHTTVIGREGMPFEVQIRTWDMHHMAEYGIAAHWKYKEGITGALGLEEKLEWVRRLLEAQQDTEAEDFIRALKIDMFADEVFVFTPKGDVINLPAGATVIDFAYAIHSAVGNRMVGAKVNSRIANYDYKLQSGDIVEIMTSNASHGPSRDWVMQAKTSEARNKIKQWFKRERRDENVARGKADLEAEMKKHGIPHGVLGNEEVLAGVLKRTSFLSLSDLYATIGFGGMTATRAANRVREEYLKTREKDQTDKDVLEKHAAKPHRPRTSVTGIIVEGIDNCLVKFSRCCSPVPGDDITGFITKGYGVSIHRKDCTNVVAARRHHDGEGRWVNVSWADEITTAFEASLEISARDRDGLVMDIARILSDIKIGIRSMNARALGDGYAAVSLIFDVRDVTQLKTVTNKLSQIQGVVEIMRRTGL